MVFISIIESEYLIVVNARIEAIWIRQLLNELGFPVQDSIVIYCNNEGVIQVVDNPVAHSKMKHVELHSHYLRQLMQDNVVSLLYCRTDD